jgi:hypothetical protein
LFLVTSTYPLNKRVARWWAGRLRHLVFCHNLLTVHAASGVEFVIAGSS